MRTSYTERNIPKDEFGDKRLVSRFGRVCDQLSEDLNQSLPQASGSKSSQKATYRFFKNPQVSPDKMIAYHFAGYQQSLAQGGPKRLLHLMDTVGYDLTTKRGAKALGPMNFKSRRGLYQHNSLLLSQEGAPLGLLKQSYLMREDAFFGQAAERKKLPFEQKESYRWYEHFMSAQQLCEQYEQLEIVSIADREADIMELFQARSCERMHFVIRSKHNRKLADGQSNLYQHLSAQAVQGTYKVTLVHPQTKKKREATVEVRFANVDIKLHNALPVKRHLSAFNLNAIEVKEIDPPDDIEQPVHWVLLTTLAVNTFDQALEVIQYYCLRWIIERFHFILKSGGAQLEELQLEQPHRLKNAMTAYSIAAMNVFKVRYWAQHKPDSSIYELGITPLEHEVLYVYAQNKLKFKGEFDSEKPPTIAQFSILLGKVGGFVPSKRQHLPGIKILQRSIAKLNTLVDAYLIFCQRTE